MSTKTPLKTVKTQVAIAVLLAAPITAHADTLLGIYAGAGVWQADIDGAIGTDSDPITTEELGLDSENNNYFYLALEHPVPVLPNIRLSQTALKHEGAATVSREFTWDNQTFSGEAATATTLDFTMTDVTLYYEILDNWVSLDIGVTGKVLDGEAIVRQPAYNRSETIELSGGLPLLYAMARFDLPLTGLYVAAKANYIGYDDSSVSDADFHIGYRLESVLDVGAELGYRQFKLDLQDFEDATANLTYDGPYLNLAIHF